MATLPSIAFTLVVGFVVPPSAVVGPPLPACSAHPLPACAPLRRADPEEVMAKLSFRCPGPLRALRGRAGGLAAEDGKGKMASAGDLLKRYGGAYLLTSNSLALVSFSLCYAAVSNGVDRESPAAEGWYRSELDFARRPARSASRTLSSKRRLAHPLPVDGRPHPRSGQDLVWQGWP